MKLTHKETNTQVRRRLTEQVTQATGERFCMRCYRYRNASTGTYKTRADGRKRWVCLDCETNWLKRKTG